jgi:hypothetical protein
MSFGADVQISAGADELGLHFSRFTGFCLLRKDAFPWKAGAKILLRLFSPNQKAFQKA